MEENWRSYLGNANVDIFEFIKKAITVAATDYPSEFQNNKDRILETLYSCESMKCYGCDKCKKRGSSSEKTQENRVSNKLEKESIPKAEISQTTSIVCRQGVAEVLRIKGILEKADARESESGKICDLLSKLRYMGLTLNTLEVTGIGKTVKGLRKHASKDVSGIAGRLMKEWKDMVEEWLKKDASVVRRTSGEQVMQTGSIAEPKFHIDSDKESKEKGQVTTDQHKTKRNPHMEKENKTATQQVNNQTKDVVKKVLPVSKPVNLVAKTQSGTNSQSSKNTKGLVIPHQQYCKLIGSQMPKRDERSVEEKLEATKRKLHQSYEDVENLKKKRRIQVLAFHELPKQGLFPKQAQHFKPQGHQIRSCGNAHRRIKQLVSTTY